MRIRKSHVTTAVVTAVVVTAVVWWGVARNQEDAVPVLAVPSPSTVAVSSASTPSAGETPKTRVPTATPYVHEGLAKAAAKNEDIVGWIRVPGTPIDYPVAQGEDNTFYLTHGSDKKKLKAGTIFLDYRCDGLALRRNNILYGHHMKDGSMFAALLEYKDPDFFEENRIIEYSTTKELTKWEVFSAYVTNPSFYYIRTDFASDEVYESFLRQIQGKSLHKTDVELTGSDDILTLSTCDYDFDDARFVVQAKRVE